MEQLKGLHFFLMSEGEYSDYGVNALYASDKPISEEDWHKFAEEESEIRRAKRGEMITEVYNCQLGTNQPYYVQTGMFYEWKNKRGTISEMFAKAYNLVKVGY